MIYYLAPLLKTRSLDIFQMILNSKGMVLLDLIILIIFSLITWYIIIFKTIYFFKTQKSNKEFLNTFWGGGNLEHIYKTSGKMKTCPLAVIFVGGYKELAKLKSNSEKESMGGEVQNLERALRKTSMVEITKLESHLPVMATIAATAPFLGLFGTVWGIMVSFSAIGAQGNTTLATVAPGIVDALVTTALGLIAAIPATIAYNIFLRKIRLQVANMETFANDFLNIAQRKFFK
jgi:biopolymer transport protein TolQ